MDDTNIPNELIQSLGSEPHEFTIKSKRAKPLGKSAAQIITGLGILAFMSIFVFSFFGALITGGEAVIKANGVLETVSRENIGPLILPALVILPFLVVGLASLISGVIYLFKAGGWYVATPTRLVEYIEGRVRSINWSEFNGVITIGKNSINMQLRTGHTTKKGRYIPDQIYISGISNVYDIENICRKNINKHSAREADELTLESQ